MMCHTIPAWHDETGVGGAGYSKQGPTVDERCLHNRTTLKICTISLPSPFPFPYEKGALCSLHSSEIGQFDLEMIPEYIISPLIHVTLDK